MFNGKAELVDPEKNTPVATFTETCQSDGTAKMKVVLKAPITISGTERLAIFSTVKDQEVIAVTANGGASTAIHEFEGTSSLGCLADKSDITLTRSPGGPSRNAPCRGRKGDDPRATVLVEDHGPLLARHRRFFLPHSSSSSRFIAGCFGFLLLRATALPFFGGIICPQSPFRMGLAASQSIDSPW